MSTKLLLLALSRREYDLLLARHAEWVRENWASMRRSWHIGGVVVTCRDEDQLAFVAAFLARHR